MEDIQSTMFALIREATFNQPCEQIVVDLGGESLEQLYNLSNSHDMAHIVGSALQKMGVLGDSEVDKKFKKKQFIAVLRYEKINFEYQRICEILEKKEISFLPLKGSVIREYYDQPWMRTSCDIDVLVHEQDLDKATECLTQSLGYQLKQKSSHDVSLFSPSGVHLELHYSLLEEDVALDMDKPLLDVWTACAIKEGCKFTYQMQNDLFYYYHIAHMAKHFLNGGCGIKPFVDLFILDNLGWDRLGIDKLLEEGGLKTFEAQALSLAKVWFGGKEHTDLTYDMQDYLLAGGVYGTIENKVAVGQAKKGGKFRYAISRIWIPFNNLKYQYPVVERHRILVPICQIRRWFRLLFKGRSAISNQEISANSNLGKDKKESIKLLLEKLNLH